MESVRRVVLQGEVQGCGLRPALARLAAGRGWSGSVRNTQCGVELIVRGLLPADIELQSIIREALPIPAKAEHIAIESCQDEISRGFRIIESATAGRVVSQIPRDRAICQTCLEEVRDSRNRRYRYPFITCAECGPRYSLLAAMPFDRERTSMRVFPMCEECRREYGDPRDRRFHTQTISCPRCGPRVWIGKRTESATGDYWDIAAQALQNGQIVALRGVGGYQLLADAASSAAVRRLRERKRRESKPFAVLCRDLATASRLAHVSQVEAEQLESAANPIVLVRQRRPSELAAELNPGISDLGLMLPTTAMHELLLAAFGGPLVCTSGNVEGEPLAFQIDEAEDRLVGIADVFLHHNREIEHPIDDSVVRVMAGRAVTLRAARGVAPLALEIPGNLSQSKIIVACGGHQKAAIALSNGSTSLLGPHVGDLDSMASLERWEAQTNGLARLIGEPDQSTAKEFVYDHHPRYASTEWGRRQAQQPHAVWHHHAHILAGMIEKGWLAREVLGVAWDGTGLGPDGTIWGGEFLRATAASFVRVAHLRPFGLPGSETCIADVRRTALSVLSQVGEMSEREIAEVPGLSELEAQRLIAVLNSSFSPMTTSCGRLFDAAACLILGQPTSNYEGHAALCLESACDTSESGAYSFPIDKTSPLQIDWRPAFRSILSDRDARTPGGRMAMKFHRGLAQAVSAVANRYPHLPVVLGGGVFQNRVLVESIVSQWHNDKQPLALPGNIPPNDGGLAAGQLAVSASAMHKERTDVPGSPRTAGRVDRSRSAAGQGPD